MKSGALLWLIIFAVSAAVFFVVAAIVAFRGLSDLRDLLGLRTGRSPYQSTTPNPD